MAVLSNVFLSGLYARKPFSLVPHPSDNVCPGTQNTGFSVFYLFVLSAASTGCASYVTLADECLFVVRLKRHTLRMRSVVLGLWSWL
jgi:hypothetical protein